mmetsp:Transcript_143393/g.357250  ORF Transcript_143393/g.357250 Transcript_143393/m.357250 type:complete len:374 (+) Transcript_143393:81-1202(+)|eukprot:CAMPEP_0115180384 /NCGR_PEP_ID=MMETSP0270-20121206/6892_1 /TAXON_ID=71861 /ORGANISM="Scrippsiella trochoidea, Strain CCMP3099" /LENGTH=373 /DNA_ID=CAMNT_0002593383 /DNA_START=76 /DNA_END=1197 /DNA_ORIENTATION=+
MAFALLGAVALIATPALVHAEGEFLAQRGLITNGTDIHALVGGMAAVEQEGANIQVGGTVRLFAVGSSNLLWETWAEQLHVLLSRLGYQTPLVQPGSIPNVTRPLTSAVCDDGEEFADVHTLRVGKPGWSSWGFAYESTNEDACFDGYRHVLGHRLSCTNGWFCRPELTGPDKLVRPSDLAAAAKNADVVLLSSWVNDLPATMPGSLCFNGESVSFEEIAAITVFHLTQLIWRINSENAGVVFVVMAKYPGAAGKVVGSDYSALNAAVRKGLADFSLSSKIIFADFSFPRDADMFLLKRSGHPNCRGDKVMAMAVVEALFRAKVLARGVAMESADECLAKSTCKELSLPCCQRSAFCTSQNGTCMPYSAGSEE